MPVGNGDGAPASAAGEYERADRVADRVAAVLDAAERAGEAIRREADDVLAARRAEADREFARVRAEAEAEAEVILRRADERAEQIVSERLAAAHGLARTLVAHATELLRRIEETDAVRSSVRALADDLDRVASGMEGLGAAAERPPQPEPEPPARGRRFTADRGGGGVPRLDPVEEARVMALQMAMAGRTRAEVENDLRHGLRLDDPVSIVDDVFGKGTAGDQRIPWAESAKDEAP